MARKMLLVLILVLWSPLALGSVILIFMSMGIPVSKFDQSAVNWAMRTWVLGLGTTIGYVSGWRFVCRLSPESKLSAGGNHRLIAQGLAIGMVSCLLMFLQIFFVRAYKNIPLDEVFWIGTVTLVPFFVSCWALNHIAIATRASLSR